MLGKTYLAMKEKEKAQLWLQKAKDYPARTLEDKEVQSKITSDWCLCERGSSFVCLCVSRL